MKKLFALLLLAPLLLLACPGEADDPDDTGKPDDTQPGKEKTYKDFPTWNEWLAHKYGKEFGWDAENGLGDLKAEITHDMSAEEYFFAKGLNAGWNLGNTHELTSNPKAATGHYEKLMPGIKAAGFNVIRIPCTWGSTVSSTFLDEVEAAVTAAHEGGLAVFINTHHDKNTFNLNRAGDSYKTDGENGADYKTYTDTFKNVWRTIATRFKDYGDWLMFEGLNEPTINGPGGGVQWDGAGPEYHEVLNRWFQALVDVVRETGGNNEKRYLIVKSYAAKLQPALDPSNGFRVPTDTEGPGRLCYSFHSYVPQPLALEGQNFSWTSSHVNQFTTAFAQAQEAFSLKGIPVFMGETGATFHSQRGGSTTEPNESIIANRNRLMSLNALGNQARKYGIIPCLWDNGEATRGATSSNPNGETFAMFKRKPAHDSDWNNYGQPIDHTKVAGGSAVASTGGSAMHSNNAARTDSEFGTYTLKAFIDAVNGETTLGAPALSPILSGLYSSLP